MNACSSTTGDGGSAAPVPPTELPSAKGGETILKSSNLAADLVKGTILDSNINFTESASFCHVQDSQDNSEGADGLCLTATNMNGHVAGVTLIESGPNGNVGRIAGADITDLAPDASGAFEVYPFDLNDELSIDSHPNFYDGDLSDVTWNKLRLNFAHLDVQALIKSQYWNVRFAFVTLPASDEEDTTSCYDAAYLSQLAANSNYLGSGISFHRGDVILCRKDAQTAACADSDWQWYDLDSSQFTTTRPSNPLQFALADRIDASCSSQYSHNLDFGGYAISGVFREFTGDGGIALPGFNLYSSINSCIQQFTYQEIGSSSTSTGNKITFDFNLDAEDVVFLPNLMSSTNLNTYSDYQILSAFTLKEMFYDLYTDPIGARNSATFGTVPTITLTDDDSVGCAE